MGSLLRFPLCLMLITAFCSVSSLSAETAGVAGVPGVVTATRLNVRVRPGTKYTQVAQLKKDSRVTVLRYKDGWYEILAPGDSNVWISSLFIENGKVTKPANLRSGPSVAHSSYRLADPGESLKVLKKSQQWTQVAPPENLTAWVSAKFVYLTPENAAKLAKKAAPAPKNANKGKSVETEKKSSKPKVKTADKETLPFLDSKWKIVTHEGMLVPLRKNTLYVTHAVAEKVNDEYFPFCYVHSDVCNLKLWENRRVRVTGRQRWVKGWQRPVVDITKITPAH